MGESVEKPLDYYENNLSGSLNLYRAMQKHGVKNIVFSSPATVYGDPEQIPVERCPHKLHQPLWSHKTNDGTDFTG